MLFNEIAYGPIHSRRLGISLGIEIMPLTAKLCTFDCVYCECGWNQPISHPILPTLSEITSALEQKLQTLSSQHIIPDVITFSGNGEPTLHPDFLTIIEATCRLRDTYCPQAKVSVLSNSTQLGRSDVVQALWKCDNRILKLDAGTDSMMRLIDQPVNKSLTVDQIITWLRQFNGDFTLQTCFLRGHNNDTIIDNTSYTELEAWYKAVDAVQPKHIMIYVIDRTTPLKTLDKISRSEMESIAAPLRAKGYDVIVSA